MAKRSNQFARHTGRLAGKVTAGIFRYAAKKHTGIGRLLAYMTPMGFIGTVKFLLLYLLIALLVGIFNGVWITFIHLYDRI
jgi:ABC-type multidrug transport system permease subunit